MGELIKVHILPKRSPGIALPLPAQPLCCPCSLLALELLFLEPTELLAARGMGGQEGLDLSIWRLLAWEKKEGAISV